MSDLNLTLRIRANADGTAQVISGTSQAIRNVGAESERASRQVQAMSATMRSAGAIAASMFTGYQAAQIIKDTVMLADKMTLLDSRVKIATGSINDYRAASQGLTNISLATGSSLESNITMFGRLNKAVESLGGSYKTTLALTKTLAEGLKISGASTGEANSVMIQLSQSLQSGVVRGDEFNSIMENGGRIVDAVTLSLGKSRGELRKMAEEGELSASVFANAVLQGSKAIHEDFGKIPLTVGAALENINTQWAKFIEHINDATASTSGLAKALQTVGEWIHVLDRGITGTNTSDDRVKALNIQIGDLAEKLEKVGNAMPGFYKDGYVKALSEEMFGLVRNRDALTGSIKAQATEESKLRDLSLNAAKDLTGSLKNQEAAQERINSVLKSRWKDEIIAAAQRHGVDPGIGLALIAQESRGKENAFNAVSGATGLGQILPGTAEYIAKVVNPGATKAQITAITQQILTDGKANIEATFDYFKILSKEITAKGGQATVENILAAYNAGAGTLSKAGFELSKMPKLETKNYVPDILAMAKLAKAEWDKTIQEGVKTTERLYTPDQQYAAELDRLGSLLKVHAIEYDVYAKGVKSARQALEQSTNVTVEAKTAAEIYLKAQLDLDAQLAGHAITQAGYNQEMLRAGEAYQKATESTVDYQNQLAMTKLLVEQNSAADDAYFAQQLAGLGYSNEAIKNEIELYHKLNAAVAAHPGLDPHAVRAATASKIGSEHLVKQLADEEKAAKTYTDALQNLDKQKLEIIGSNQQVYDQGLQELQQKGLLTAKEHAHLLALYETNQMLKAKKEAFGTLINSAKSALDGIIDGTKTFSQAFTGIFDSMIASVQNKLLEFMSNNFMSGNWSGLFGNMIGLAATYIPKLFSSNNKTTPSAATSTQNKNLYGTGQMAIADTTSRDFYQASTIDSIRNFNNAVDFVATQIRQNSDKLMTVAGNYLSRISTQIFSESTLNALSLFKNSVTSLYADVTKFGTELMSGWNGIVSSATNYLAELTGVGATKLSTAVNAAWSQGIQGSQTTVAGSVQAAEATGSSAGAGSKLLGQATATVGAIYSVVKLGLDLYDIASNDALDLSTQFSQSMRAGATTAAGLSLAFASLAPILGPIGLALQQYHLALDIATHGLTVQNGAALGGMATGAMVGTYFFPGIGTVIGALLGAIIGELAGSFGMPEPSAGMLTRPTTYNMSQHGATYAPDGSYFTSSGPQSSTVGVDTAFGSLEFRFNDFDNTIQQVTDTFLPLARTTKAFDAALAGSITAVDGTGATLTQFAQRYQSKELERNLQGLDSGSMIAERFGWIAETLKQTDTLAGKVAGTWMQAFYSKLMQPGNGKNNQLQVFNIEAMIAASLPELTKLPLKLADLFVKSVKSVADGATQAQFEAQMNDFFTGYHIAEQGLKQVGIEINNTALPDYLASLTGIGFTVKESAVALVKYAQTFGKAGGDVTAAFDTAFNNIFKQAKERAFSNEQTTGYLTSYTTLAGVASDLGLKTSHTELNTLSLSLNDVAVKATQASNDIIDHAIADNKLTNITRTAAIEQLHLAGKIDDATLAGAAYGKALTDAQLATFNNINLVDEFATRTNTALGSVFNSFGDLVSFSNDLVKAFGDVKAAGEAWMSTLRGVYSGKELADQTVRWIQKEFNSQAASMGLKGLRQEDFNAGIRLLNESKVALPENIKWADVLRLGQLNDQLNQARQSANSASTDISTPLQKITSFVPEAAKSVDNLGNAAADAAPKIKALADNQLSVNDRLRELGSTEVQNGLAAIDAKIAAIIKTASDNGGTVANIDQLKTAEVKNYFKPFIDEFNAIGKTDMQKSLASITDWANNMRAVAPSIASAYNITTDQAIAGINAIAAARTKDAEKAIHDARAQQQIQLLELSGDKIGALNAKRELEIAALDKSLQADARRINMLNDWAPIMEEFNAIGKTDAQKNIATANAFLSDTIAKITGAVNTGMIDAAHGIDALSITLSVFQNRIKSLTDEITKANAQTLKNAGKSQPQIDIAAIIDKYAKNQQVLEDSKKASIAANSQAYQVALNGIDSVRKEAVNWLQAQAKSMPGYTSTQLSELGNKTNAVNSAGDLTNIAYWLQGQSQSFVALQKWLTVNGATLGSFSDRLADAFSALDAATATAAKQPDITGATDANRAAMWVEISNWFKSVADEVTADGKSEQQKALLTATDWAKGWMGAINEAAAALGDDPTALAVKNDAIDLVKKALWTRFSETFKPFETDFNDLGKSDYSKSVQAVNDYVKNWTDAINTAQTQALSVASNEAEKTTIHANAQSAFNKLAALQAAKMAEAQKAITDFMQPFNDAAATRGMSDLAKEQYNLTQSYNKNSEAARKLGISEQDLGVIRSNYLADQQAAIANARKPLEATLYGLSHTEIEAIAQARRLEIAALDESLRPLQSLIYTLTDLKTNVTKAQEALKSAVDAQIKALQEQATAAHDALSKTTELMNRSFSAETDKLNKGLTELNTKTSDFKALVDGFDGVIKSIKNEPNFAQEQYALAKATLSDMLGMARAGDFSTMKDGAKNLDKLGGDNSKYFVTAVDYQREQQLNINALDELKTLTGAQGTDTEKLVKNTEAQIKALEELKNKTLGVDTSVDSVESAIRKYGEAKASADAADLRVKNEQFTATYNALTGINTSVLSVADAINNYQTALTAQLNGNKQVQVNPAQVAATASLAAISNSMYATAGVNQATLVAVDNLYTNAAKSTGVAAPTNVIENLYTTIAGRNSDPNGFAYWDAKLAAGEPLAQITQEFQSAVMGIRGFAVGTNYVPDDMIAQIHKGERIIPAADNANLMSLLSRNADPSERLLNLDELVAEVKALRDEAKQAQLENKQLQFELVRTNRKLAELAEKNDVIGTPPVRA